MGSLTGGTGLKIPGALTQGLCAPGASGAAEKSAAVAILTIDRCKHREPMLGWPPPRYQRAGVFGGRTPMPDGMRPLARRRGMRRFERGGNRLESGGRPGSVHSSPRSAERALYERASALV